MTEERCKFKCMLEESDEDGVFFLNIIIVM